jgi:NAD(P)-dependent dehydrogenase (short-subunit alcohol dehydrogenase family)
MQGRVCVVTGASSGIGKATANGLAELGATVVMVCRDQERGEAAKAEIEAASSARSVDLFLADLSVQSSIRLLAHVLQERYPQIHVLINNAGIASKRRSITADGIETTFAVNYLAAFLLTNLLLERLKVSAPSRIVNVSSMLHSPLDFSDLQSEQHFRRAYSRSKFALILFTYELARRLQGTGVTANCLNPGFVASNLSRNEPSLVRWMVRHIAASPEKGAKTSLYLASSPEVQKLSGKYYSHSREIRSSSATCDEVASRRLWEMSAALTKLDSLHHTF